MCLIFKKDMLYQTDLFYTDKINFLKDVKQYFLANKLAITKDNILIGYVKDVKINKDKSTLYLTLDNDSIIKYII